MGKTAVAGVLLAAALAAGLGGIVAQRARLFQRLSDNVSALARGDGLAALSRERYFLWREALAMARDYPVSGVGAGAYILELPNYYAKDTTFSSTFTEEWKRVASAENLPLHLSAELGLTGLLALLWLLAALGVLAFRSEQLRGGKQCSSRWAPHH